MNNFPFTVVTPNNTSNAVFESAADFIRYTNAPVFLTGKAGTGKTTFLKFIKENEVKNSVVVAPTGIAAINAGGTTIHSFFQLPFGPYIPVGDHFITQGHFSDKHSLLSRLRLTNDHKDLIKKLELLIIDEISMVRCDVLDAIDTILRHIRNRHSSPFGGVQVLFIGDIYQLPPVNKEEDWQLLSRYYKSPYFFSSHVIESNLPVYIELDKVYRQKDPEFIGLLNQVRNNQLNKQGYNLLHSRFLPDSNPNKRENYITLTTHNKKADAINLKALAELEGKLQTFTAVIEGDFFESMYPTELSFRVKVGAQVMFIKNDTEKTRRYYNGKIGIVEKTTDDSIFVLCKNEDSLIEVKKEKWKNIRYTVDKVSNQVEHTEIGSFLQYPLRLAWAITIHKSQGLTFEKAIIDAGQAFDTGQVYVALSRCTNLQGIILHSRISPKSISIDHRIDGFIKNQQRKNDQANVLYAAKCEFQKNTILQLFDFSEELFASNALLNFIREEREYFNKEAPVLMEEIINRIGEIILVAKKFLPYLETAFKDPVLPEQNSHLQKRMPGAINHFSLALQNISEEINKSIIVTDSKKTAVKCNRLLLHLYQQITFHQHLLFSCKDGFSINNFLHGKRSFIFKEANISVYSGKASYTETGSPHPELYKLLREKRNELCDQKNTPVYLIANNSMLEDMARYLPQTLDEMSRISGFGKIKLQQVGDSFLQVINVYCEKNDLQTNIDSKPTKSKKREKNNTIKPDTKAISFSLYMQGKGVVEIAKERNMATSTIEGHLAYFVSIGKIDITSIVPMEKQSLIKEAVKQHGGDHLKTLIDHITGDVSYGELRMVLASMKNMNGDGGVRTTAVE